MIVKVYITLEVDEDDYQIPADENPSEEIRELLRDVYVLKIKYIKTKMEKNT